MALPIVIVTSGGIAITESTNGIGLPVEIATNGFGIGARIVASGGLGVLGSASGTPVVVPAAPALTWNSTSSDTTPDFLVDLPSGNTDPIQDAAAGDHLILEYQLQAGGAWTQYLDHTLSSGDITGDIISQSGVTPVASGDYYFRGRLERGALIGTNSSSVAVTIAAASANNRIASASNRRISSAGNYRIAA